MGLSRAGAGARQHKEDGTAGAGVRLPILLWCQVQLCGRGLAAMRQPAGGGVLIIGFWRDKPDEADGHKQQDHAPYKEADGDQHGISS